jgi:hypothetical protein
MIQIDEALAKGRRIRANTDIGAGEPLLGGGTCSIPWPAHPASSPATATMKMVRDPINLQF